MHKKICFVVTVSITVSQFLLWCFEDLRANGYEITIIANMDNDFIKTLPKYVTPVPVKMRRGIDVVGFVIAVKQMFYIFKEKHFDIVQYSTPNASLYASIAAMLAKVPVRLYCQWGLVSIGFSGLNGIILELIERVVCKFSTDIQPDSKGNLDFCRQNKYYRKEKSRIVWNGSANGLNLKKFDIAQKEIYRKEIRKRYNINDKMIVLGFLGRIGKEKGFNELIYSFRQLQKKYSNLKLLFVGPNEKPNTVDKNNLKYFINCEDIIYTDGWVDDTERYYSAMDIFLFPSYHEGFGSVVIEAEAMGVPVIVSDIPGPQNGVMDGITGYKVPRKSVELLVKITSLLIENKQLRENMGNAAVKYAKENFDSKILIKKIIENKDWLLNRTNNIK